MVWAAIGAATIGVVGGAIVNGGGKGGGGQAAASTGASTAAQAADPFAAQRYQYQSQLQDLMTNPAYAKMDAGAQANMNFYAMGGTAQPLMDDAQAMLKPGYDFKSSDPSYAFRLAQGTENLNRGAAASGLLDSGNRLAALQDYGQNTASTEFGAEYARRMQGVQAATALDTSHYTENAGINTDRENQYQAQYARLAQLSGANTGSPTAASGAINQANAGAAAQVDKWGNIITGGAGKLWDAAKGLWSDDPAALPGPTQSITPYAPSDSIFDPIPMSPFVYS